MFLISNSMCGDNLFWPQLLEFLFPLFFAHCACVPQMIESSTHGDEYDEVMYSQLVCDITIKLRNFTLHSCSTSPHLFFQNLIDLAGSESSKTETTGLRRKEGSYINKSLLTLGTVSVYCPSFSLSSFFFVTAYDT